MKNRRQFPDRLSGEVTRSDATGVAQLGSWAGFCDAMLPGFPYYGEVLAFRYDGPSPEGGFYWVLRHHPSVPDLMIRQGGFTPCGPVEEIGGEHEFAVNVMGNAFPNYRHLLEESCPRRGGLEDQHYFAVSQDKRHSIHFWF